MTTEHSFQRVYLLKRTGKIPSFFYFASAFYQYGEVAPITLRHVPVVVKVVQFVFKFRVGNVFNRAEKFLRGGGRLFKFVPFVVGKFVCLGRWGVGLFFFATKHFACQVGKHGVGHHLHYRAHFVVAARILGRKLRNAIQNVFGVGGKEIRQVAFLGVLRAEQLPSK